MSKRLGLAIAMAVVAATALAAPASARWYGNGRWHEDDRRWDHHYYGYHYQAPPVIYGTPYNYGYVPPPVVYGAEPGGINLNIRIP